MRRDEAIRLLGLCAQCEMALVRRDAVVVALLAQASRAATEGIAATALAHAANMARNPGTVTRMIERSIANKAAIVSADEREAGIRALLNFGHTFAHAFETLTGYERYLHGEAVAIGMMVATRLSEIRGLCDSGMSNRLAELLSVFDLPLGVPADLDAGQILTTMKLDKKVLAGQARLVLLESAGHGLIDTGSEAQQIIKAIEASRA